MVKIDAHKAGCELLNTIIEMEDVSPEVRDRVINALILIDPQPEESDLFYGALAYASDITSKAAEEVLEEVSSVQ